MWIDNGAELGEFLAAVAVHELQRKTVKQTFQRVQVKILHVYICMSCLKIHFHFPKLNPNDMSRCIILCLLTTILPLVIISTHTFLFSVVMHAVSHIFLPHTRKYEKNSVNSSNKRMKTFFAHGHRLNKESVSPGYSVP